MSARVQQLAYTHNTLYVYNYRVHIILYSPVATHECSAKTTKAPCSTDGENLFPHLSFPPPRREFATSETPSANHRPKTPGKEKAPVLLKCARSNSKCASSSSFPFLWPPAWLRRAPHNFPLLLLLLSPTAPTDRLLFCSLEKAPVSLLAWLALTEAPLRGSLL